MNYIYGMHVEYVNGMTHLDKYTFDAKPSPFELDLFIANIAEQYGKTVSEVTEALFLFETVDGEPAQEDDLYEEIDLELDETKAETIARLDYEADVEEGLVGPKGETGGEIGPKGPCGCIGCIGCIGCEDSYFPCDDDDESIGVQYDAKD